jgi:hypothetical protein
LTHAKQIVKLRLMFKVAQILDTDLIQIPSQVSEGRISGEFNQC